MQLNVKRRGQPSNLRQTVSHLGSRYPFTLALLAGVGIATLATRTHKQELSATWLARLGFGADDVLPLRLRRLLGAAFVTHGPHAFGPSYTMLALSTATAEHIARQSDNGPCILWHP